MKMLMTAAMLLAGSGSAHAAPGPGETAASYPPCSRTVTDSCIQSDAAEGRAMPAMRAETGVGGPFEPVQDAVEDHAEAAPDDANSWSASNRSDAEALPERPFRE